MRQLPGIEKPVQTDEEKTLFAELLPSFTSGANAGSNAPDFADFAHTWNTEYVFPTVVDSVVPGPLFLKTRQHLRDYYDVVQADEQREAAFPQAERATLHAVLSSHQRPIARLAPVQGTQARPSEARRTPHAQHSLLPLSGALPFAPALSQFLASLSTSAALAQPEAPEPAEQRAKRQHKPHLCKNCGLVMKGNGHQPQKQCPNPANVELVQRNTEEALKAKKEAAASGRALKRSKSS